MSNKKWKDYLLKSSLPLEYEVKSFLVNEGFFTEFEYSYLRSDEEKIINEFSYDINALKYIIHHHNEKNEKQKGYYIELMIECKYRDRSTNWIFIPHEYGEDEEHYLTPTGFMNFSDLFTEDYKFMYEGLIGAICPAAGKGIEINSNGQNPKSVTQASKQLSYAITEKMLNGIKSQISYSEMKDMVIVQIPIIITTAKLFRLKEECTIADIEKANDIKEVAKEEKSILLKNFVGEDLKKHNREQALNFLKENRKKLAERFNEKDSNLEESLLSLVVNRPTSLLVIHHDNEKEGYEQLLKEIREIEKPTDITFKRFEESERRYKKIIENFNVNKNQGDK